MEIWYYNRGGGEVMKKFRVYGIITASTCIGEYDAETAEEAEKMAWEDAGYPSICYQCSKEIDLGEIYELQVEEA